MQILRVFSLCSSLLFGTSPCTAYRSCLSLPAALASSSQLWKHAELYLDFPSLSYGQVINLGSHRAHQVCLSYLRDHCHSLPAISILKTFIYFAFSQLFQAGEYIQSLLLYFGQKWSLPPFFSPFLYNEICVGRFLSNYPKIVKGIMLLSMGPDHLNKYDSI